LALSELRAAVATVELDGGANRRARKLFESAEPTETLRRPNGEQKALASERPATGNATDSRLDQICTKRGQLGLLTGSRAVEPL
jgi:hypothetical protein